MLNLSPLQNLLQSFAKIVGALIPILVTLGLAIFLWGLIRYLWYSGSNPKNLDKAKLLMRWGLLILFVMVSVWGIIALIQVSLGINPNATGRAPQIQYGGSSTFNAHSLY